jgi:hypothetical protein
MISPKTTALIAAMSLLGAAAPAAFAQSFSNSGDVTSNLAATINANVNQALEQNAASSASNGDFSENTIVGVNIDDLLANLGL